MKRIALLMAPVGLALSATACGELENDSNGDVVCQDGGRSYKVEESFLAQDGCNTCFCAADGSVNCTLRFCPDTCSEPAVYQEPGCEPPQGAITIEPACYVPCQGAPCGEGSCQLAHVNPCLCWGEEVCCDACGADEWLCLDTTPDACIDLNNGPMLAGAGKSFGECSGECDFDLELEATNGCAGVAMSICGWGSEGCSRENRGTLTPVGQMNAAGLAVELSGVELESVYGCPDCADGGASRITLRFGGEEQDVKYEYSNPPAVLEKVDAFQRDLIDALDSCTSTANITVASDCQPKQS